MNAWNERRNQVVDRFPDKPCALPRRTCQDPALDAVVTDGQPGALVRSHDPARRFAVWIDHLAEQSHRCPTDQHTPPAVLVGLDSAGKDQRVSEIARVKSQPSSAPSTAAAASVWMGRSSANRCRTSVLAPLGCGVVGYSFPSGWTAVSPRSHWGPTRRSMRPRSARAQRCQGPMPTRPRHT